LLKLKEMAAVRKGNEATARRRIRNAVMEAVASIQETNGAASNGVAHREPDIGAAAAAISKIAGKKCGSILASLIAIAYLFIRFDRVCAAQSGASPTEEAGGRGWKGFEELSSSNPHSLVSSGGLA
jgi:hypothetical protein